MHSLKLPKSPKALRNKLSKVVMNIKNIISRSRQALLDKVNGKGNGRGYNKVNLITLYNTLSGFEPTTRITLASVAKVNKSIFNKGMSFQKALEEVKNYLIQHHITQNFEMNIQSLLIKKANKKSILSLNITISF
jgi:hypothetical protein